MFAFAFKIIFPEIKKVSFPQSKNFSTVKEIWHSQGSFPALTNRT